MRHLERLRDDLVGGGAQPGRDIAGSERNPELGPDERVHQLQTDPPGGGLGGTPPDRVLAVGLAVDAYDNLLRRHVGVPVQRQFVISGMSSPWARM